MPLKTRPDGPKNAKIMIVGEAPGVEEERQGVPFVGSSGEELTRMLHEAGIARTECFLTNVCKYRPFNNEIWRFFEDAKSATSGTFRNPNALVREGLAELHAEIHSVRPNVIVAFGNTALWALQDRPSAKAGIGSWRGSELYLSNRIPTVAAPVLHRAVVVPTYHPAAILRQWAWRQIVVRDLKARVSKYVNDPTLRPPSYNFTIRPSFTQVMECLERLSAECRERQSLGRKRKLAVDIETRQGHLACVGLGWSNTDALCIPFMCVERPEGYWAFEEELAIMLKLGELLTAPGVSVVGQNFLYDAQYFAYHFGFLPRVQGDTMFMQHVCYAGMQKGLDFLSSMYCTFHQYWKDDGKTWNPKVPEEQLWAYNCTDCVKTYEIMEVLEGVPE